MSSSFSFGVVIFLFVHLRQCVEVELYSESACVDTEVINGNSIFLCCSLLWVNLESNFF